MLQPDGLAPDGVLNMSIPSRRYLEALQEEKRATAEGRAPEIRPLSEIGLSPRARELLVKSGAIEFVPQEEVSVVVKDPKKGGEPAALPTKPNNSRRPTCLKKGCAQPAKHLGPENGFARLCELHSDEAAEKQRRARERKLNGQKSKIGRPPVAYSIRKDLVVAFRLTVSEENLIIRAAKAANMTPAVWMRFVLIRAAELSAFGQDSSAEPKPPR